jgi:acetyl esterase/lipase
MRVAVFVLAIGLVATLSLSLPGVQGLLTPTPETIHALVAESKAMPPAPGPVHLDLVYRRSPFRSFRLDLYEPLAPTKPGDAPLVVFFHGGSWIHGDKSTIRIIDRFLRRMREEGYFVASVNYTTSIYRGLEGPIDNAEKAFSWLVQKADRYGYDPDQIGLYGVSAGAHVALMLASRIVETQESRGLSKPSFVFAESSPTDLLAMKNGDAFEHSTSFRVFPDKRLAALSPIYRVNSELPPVLLYHGGADRTVHIRQAERYADALAAVGGHVELVRYPEGNHAFLNLPDEVWYQQESRALEYFEKRFRKPTPVPGA